MKSFLAAVLGIIASIIVVYLGEMLAMLIFPIKEKIDPTDIEAIREMIKHVPFLALIAIIISHGLGMLIGSFVSFKIQQKSPMPVLVIFLFMLINFLMRHTVDAFLDAGLRCVCRWKNGFSRWTELHSGTVCMDIVGSYNTNVYFPRIVLNVGCINY